MIGQDHIRRLTTVLSGASVTAVTDVDAARAQEVADGVAGARVHATEQDVIHDDDVDAVVVCSWGPTHEEYVLAAIDAGKPVFCEKPLATTQEACLRILDAEVARGRRLVQVGYMRRYDARLPGAEGRRHSGDDRGAAAHALPAPQPVGAGALHQRDGDHRHRRARHRRGPLDARRGDRGGDGAHAAAQQQRRRAAGSRCSCCSRPRAACSSTSRLRSTSATATTSAARSSARTAPRRWATRARSSCAGRWLSPAACRSTGGSGSCAPTTSSSRSGSTRCRGGGRHRPERLGRLRRRRGLRRRASRRCDSGERVERHAAAQAGSLRQGAVRTS